MTDLDGFELFELFELFPDGATIWKYDEIWQIIEFRCVRVLKPGGSLSSLSTSSENAQIREGQQDTCHGVNVTTKLGRKDSSAGSEASRIVKDCRQKTPEIRGKPSPGRSAPERRSLAELGVHHVHPCQRNSKNGCKVRLVNVDSNQGHRTQDS